MVAWPGEKLDLWDAIVESGGLDPFDIYAALRLPESPDTTLTVTAGDSFYVYSRWTNLLLESDPIGECNWIIDVVAGSAAVTIETAYDVDWSYAPPFAWSPTATSTLATGRSVVPLPVGDRTFARLVDEGAPLLRITVVSGSVELRAVWLQVEPPGGLLVRTGWEWSDYVTPDLVWAPGDIGIGFAGSGIDFGAVLDRSGALDALRAGDGNIEPPLAPSGAPPNSYQRSGPIDGALFSNSFETFAYDRANSINTSPPGSFAWLTVGYSYGWWRERPDHRVVPAFFGELIAGRDYEKVDPGSTWESFGEFADGDTVAVEWGPVNTFPAYNPSPGADESFGATISIAHTALLTDTAGAWTGSFTGWPPPLGGVASVHVTPAESGSLVELGTPPPGSDFTVTVRGDMADAGVYPTTGDPGDTSNQAWLVRPNVSIHYQMPNFRYRVPVFEPDPDAAGSPRFYVKDLDGVMRPVGFGKPADETAMFHVPTATGMYRDLTTAEYVTYGPESRPPDGYPLKVKRRDTAGETWWDHVGWMVPDA